MHFSERLIFTTKLGTFTTFKLATQSKGEWSRASEKVGQKSFRCPCCQRSFTHKTNRDTHSRLHTGDKPYQCQECLGSSFQNMGAYRVHQRLVHGDPIPNECQYCDRCFKDKEYLMKHERTHDGSRPYQCNYCQKTFAQISNRTLHEKIHESEKAYKCQQCDMGFNLRHKLVLHQRIHDNNNDRSSCQFCVKAFRQSEYRLLHERIHLGKKPYECGKGECRRRFAQGSAAANHRRAHTGHRPYQCQYCHETFAQLANRDIHEMRRHLRGFKIRQKTRKTFEHIQKNITV